MASSSQPRVVAVIDSDPDSIELIKTILEIHGMVAAIGSLIEFRLGKASLVEFLQRTTPDVLVFDLGLPYEANYQFLRKSMEDPAFPKCGIVLTTTNARAVETLLGVRAVEILGKPFDLEQLVDAIQSARTADERLDQNHSADEEAIGGERREQQRRTGPDRRRGDAEPGESVH
jgi:CheY-like chemotaxis protein